MKVVLLLAVILAVWWLIRRNARPAVDRRKPASVPAPPPAADASAPQAIVACRFCGLHLPAGEALAGRDGVFCDVRHREAYEAVHPPA